MNGEEFYRAMVKAYEKYQQDTCKIYDKRLEDNEMKELLKKLSDGVISQYKQRK